MPQPRSCSFDGDPSLTAAPLPAMGTRAGWSGTCTFDAGVYALVCSVHPEMTGTITVIGDAAPVDSGTPPPPPPAPVAPLGPAGGAVTVAAIQHGTVVRGSLNVARAGSQLSVGALVARNRLSHTKRTGTTSVASFKRASLGGRRVAFTLALDATAKRALKRAGRLAVTVQISVKPKTGATFTARRAVTLRAAG